MKIFNKRLLASLLVLGAFGIASCDDDDLPPDATPPTVEVVGEASKQAFIEADSTLKFTVSVNAPEGFDSLEITSDRGFSDDSTTSDVNSFDIDLDIDVSTKDRGAEVFTFKVTDALGQTDTVNVTAIYRGPAVSYEVTLGNANDPSDIDDGISDSNKAFLSLTSGLDFSVEDILNNNDEEANDIHVFYYQIDTQPRLLPTARDEGSFVVDELDWTGEKFDVIFREITSAEYDAVAAATGFEQVLLLDSTFEEADASGDQDLDIQEYAAYKIVSTGETGVYASEPDAGNVNLGEDLKDNKFTFTVITNLNK